MCQGRKDLRKKMMSPMWRALTVLLKKELRKDRRLASEKKMGEKNTSLVLWSVKVDWFSPLKIGGTQINLNFKQQIYSVQ